MHFCSKCVKRNCWKLKRYSSLAEVFTGGSISLNKDTRHWKFLTAAASNAVYCYPLEKVNLNSSGSSSSVNQTKTLARASAPALAMNGFEGWNATSNILSSNFFRCAVISWTQVLVSRFHKRTPESWPGKIQNHLLQQLMQAFFLHSKPKCQEIGKCLGKL